MMNGPEGLAADDLSVIVDGVRVDLKIEEIEAETKQVEALQGKEFVKAAIDSLDQELTPENRAQLENGDLEKVESILRDMLFIRLEAKKQKRDGYLKLERVGDSFINPTLKRIHKEYKPEDVKKWLISNRAICERIHIPQKIRTRLDQEKNTKPAKADLVYRWLKLEERINNLEDGAEKKSLQNRLYSESTYNAVSTLEDIFFKKDVLDTEREGERAIKKILSQ